MQNNLLSVVFVHNPDINTYIFCLKTTTLNPGYEFGVMRSNPARPWRDSITRVLRFLCTWRPCWSGPPRWRGRWRWRRWPRQRSGLMRVNVKVAIRPIGTSGRTLICTIRKWFHNYKWGPLFRIAYKSWNEYILIGGSLKAYLHGQCFSVSDATAASKDRNNPIFCALSDAAVASDTEKHGLCKQTLKNPTYSLAGGGIRTRFFFFPV
jgi:hypothetical protein